MERKMRVYTRTEKARLAQHEVNEDRSMFSEFSFMGDRMLKLMVLADGMGGLEDGEKASANAISGFLKSFYGKLVQLYMDSRMESFSLSYYADRLEEIMIEAVKDANKEVCDRADPRKPTGTTLSAVCIMDDYAVLVNVGDSPVYFYRAGARELKLISRLQTQAELDADAGKYERYSGEYYANDHRLYCCLGQYSSLTDEDIYHFSIGGLKKGDMLLAGSDGAFGWIQEAELQELLEGGEAEESYLLRRLFRMARLDKDDDQTAILYVVDEED